MIPPVQIDKNKKSGVAVFIPCFNEALTIEKVVRETRGALPAAQIYVFDNNSTDETARLARAAGAIVVRSPKQGKGHVVRHAFQVIDADIVVMIDGDDTYPIERAMELIPFVQRDGFDMVVGTRLTRFSEGAFRRFHLFGNRFLSRTVSSFFGQEISDMLSGFRVFSRKFVEEVPLNSKGFEIETDLTLQAISKGYAIKEVPIEYRHRPEGSVSKLKTFDDGFLILKFILQLIRDYRPLTFFSSLAGGCWILGAMAGWAPVRDFILHAYVYTVPRAILAASLILLGAVLFGVGLILDSQNRHFAAQFAMLQKMGQSKHRREVDVARKNVS
jgi:glycosyltransferase involved in cell wall biosynthesis